MDVRCERCNIEYEFDESKVTAAGVTVKCAHCGHLFKVRRKPEADRAAASSDERTWMLRDARSGEIRQFRELTTLQQWIVERRVTRDDQISRSGESWKPLGGISELTPFFRVVDMAAGSPKPKAAAGLAHARTEMALPRVTSPGAFEGASPS